MDYGADANYENGVGMTPSHFAIWEGDAASTMLLLERGASVFPICKVDGMTPLDRSVDRKCFNIATMIVEYGATRMVKLPRAGARKSEALVEPVSENLMTVTLEEQDLLLSAFSGDLEKTRRLVQTELGHMVSALSGALHVADMRGLGDVVKFLLAKVRIQTRRT